jgi:hypothetical protein
VPSLRSAPGDCVTQRGLTNDGRDDIWVDGVGPRDQGGGDRMERRTLFELSGRNCGQRSIRDTLCATDLEGQHTSNNEGDRSQKEGTHNDQFARERGAERTGRCS